MIKRKNFIYSSTILALAIAGIMACSKAATVDTGGVAALSEFAILLAQEMTYSNHIR